MTDVQIPLRKIPNQSLSCVLAGQSCIITIRMLGKDLYLSLSKDGIPICQNVLLVDRSAIVRAAYTGFVGDLIVVDKAGQESPQYTGWNDRWLLLYNEKGYNWRG